MPERIWAFFESLPVPVKSMLLASVIAFLRVMYDDKEPRFWRRALEATLCGMIALAVASGAEALGISNSFSTFLGGAIGLFGADQVRAWGRQVVRSRIRKSHESTKQ